MLNDFSHFRNALQADAEDFKILEALPPVDFVKESEGCRRFFSELEGKSFDRGIYRVLWASDVGIWEERIVAAFPDFDCRIIPFAYDWLGRFFCLDKYRVRIADKEPQVLLFSHISDEVLEVPANIYEFHNDILVDQADIALETNLFTSFLLNEGLERISRTQCAELIVPLFLGGDYACPNMKIAGIEVTWNIVTQLLSQVRKAGAGDVIRSVKLNR